MSPREELRRLGRATLLGLALTGTAGLAIVGTAPPAAAQFAYTTTAGPQADATATEPTPAGVKTNTTNYTCAIGQNVDIILTWTGSTLMDPDNKYVVGYYGVYYALNGSTTYTFVGDTEGAPPAATYTFVGNCEGPGIGTATVDFEVQAAQTTAGAGFLSAYSTPVQVSVKIT
jgi:hypothetical protein